MMGMQHLSPPESAPHPAARFPPRVGRGSLRRACAWEVTGPTQPPAPISCQLLAPLSDFAVALVAVEPVVLSW